MTDGALVAEPEPKETTEETNAEVVEEAATRVGAFILMEAFQYFSYLIRVPVVLCSLFIALMAFLPIVGNTQVMDFLGVTIYRLYLLFTTYNIREVIHPSPVDYHSTVQGAALWPFMIRAYAIFSTCVYFVGLPFRFMLRGRPKLTYRAKFKIFAAASALSWGLALRFLTASPSGPGKSPWGFVTVMIVFYFITLAAYGVALSLYAVADLCVETGNKRVQAMRDRHKLRL